MDFLRRHAGGGGGTVFCWSVIFVIYRFFFHIEDITFCCHRILKKCSTRCKKSKLEELFEKEFIIKKCENMF